MKNSNTSQRLKEILTEKNIRPIDLVNKCQPYCKKYNIKMGRNDISQYLSGKVEPSQKKLSILALTLNVDEVWLMGYDVPKFDNKDLVDINDLSNIKLKDILIKKGILDENDNISEEDAEKLINIALANKDVLIKK